MPDFTNQEARIVNALSDGRPHTVAELLKHMKDELADRGALLVVITRIRKKLKPYDQYIHCITGEGVHPSQYIHLTRPPILQSSIL